MSAGSRSLAQAQREKLVGEIKRRGRKTANIWLLTDPTNRRDVVLVGDIRMEHFFATQGDPTVDKVEYEPAPIDVDGEAVKFDAIVDLRNGLRECHHVRRIPLEAGSPQYAQATQAAGRLGGCYVVVSTKELDAQRQRIQNWQRALAALNRCGQRPLELVEFDVLARLGPGQAITLGELRGLSTHDPSLLIAAGVRLLRKRALVSDLDSRPWSKHTCIERACAA